MSTPSRSLLALLVPALLLSCGPQPQGGAGSSPGPAVAAGSPRPGATPAAGSPSPGQAPVYAPGYQTPPAVDEAPPPPVSPGAEPSGIPTPSGALTDATARVWTGETLPWRVAMVNLLTNPENPLQLTDDERGKVVSLLARYSVAKEKWDFRVSELYKASGGWKQVDQMGYIPSKTPPEEILLMKTITLEGALQRAADGAEASPAALPPSLAKLQPSPRPFREQPSDWEQAVPADRRMEPEYLASAVDAIVLPLKGERAAQTRAALTALREPLEDLVPIWTELTQIATATPERQQLMSDTAGGLEGQVLDWPATVKEASGWVVQQARAR